jgi:sec-independent protein translocase protein TatB
MFDIAWSELFVIVIVALVVVGPKDLPKLMRTAGQWAGRARAMADQFRRSFDDMARQAELDELRTEVNRLKSDAIKPMTDADYEAFGIPVSSLPPAPTIAEVGAAPPVFDNPPTQVESVPAPAPQPAPAETANEPAHPDRV